MLIEQLREQGHPISVLNMGGGFGIHYRKQEALPAPAFAEVIVPAVQKAKCQLVLEPGRFIVGNAGMLVSRVIYTKESGGKHFVIQDAAMNDLIRPTLYDSFHRIWPVEPPAGFPAPPDDYEADIPGTVKQDVVGPVCESGDFLAKDRRLPPLQRGDLLADVQRRRLRHGDEVQLQQPAARRRGAGGRRPASADPPPRNVRRSDSSGT